MAQCLNAFTPGAASANLERMREMKQILHIVEIGDGGHARGLRANQRRGSLLVKLAAEVFVSIGAPQDHAGGRRALVSRGFNAHHGPSNDGGPFPSSGLCY